MSEDDSSRKISVQELNDSLDTDRTEMKNVLEHLRELGFINIETIGGPLLYGHISITAAGLRKYNDI
ncbi:hypothetical protein [Fodinibius sediminis]|nr:hypothetical protein [Fodinibius sediminis]